MDFFKFMELLVLAVGLSMDAFAVAICKGLAIPKTKLKESVIVGAWFGIFQGIMPLIGYSLGVQFKKYITEFDHWIAFVLLALIGANMIKEALSKDEEPADASLKFRNMLVLALATSIDALASGISLLAITDKIFIAVIIIGITTFVLSALGVKIGNIFGVKYKSKAELAGGVILILLGSKILLEHLFV